MTHTPLSRTEVSEMNDLDSINVEQGLYVLKSGSGYSCLGFDVAFNRAKAVHEWLKGLGVELEPPREDKKGTETGYFDYCKFMNVGSAVSTEHKVRCEADLTPQLKGLEGRRVEVVDRDGQKRRFQVGRSTGWMPIHLEIHNRRSTGGSGTYGTPYQSVRVIR